MEKGYLENFAKFTGEHLCQSLFLTVFIRLEALIWKIRKTCNLSKKRLWNRCFPVNFAKFQRTIFFKDLSVAISALKNLRGDSFAYIV